MNVKEIKKKGMKYKVLGLASIVAISFFTRDFLGGIRDLFRWKR